MGKCLTSVAFSALLVFLVGIICPVALSLDDVNNGAENDPTAFYGENEEAMMTGFWLESLTLDEKISLVHGMDVTNYTGQLAGIPRFSIPSIALNDGPQGFRAKVPGTSTAWPCALNMAATWDVDLTTRWGAAMAREFRDKGTSVLLGPGVNVIRIPQNGRNFEYLSGEDPVLGASLVSAQISAIQGEGIIANIKHFVHNNQETERTHVDSVVDHRTHWELYMPPFEAAVKAGVLSVMCSYNKINGRYACENASTIGDLKSKLGFRGFVVTDWGAAHSLMNGTASGLDMEMPKANHYGDELKNAILKNKISMKTLDGMVTRVLVAMIVSGVMKDPPTGDENANVTSQAHNLLARELAAAGVILLKNEQQILPMNKETQLRIVVLGDMIAAGGGSGHVVGPYVISGFEGIRQKCSDGLCSVTNSSMKSPDFEHIKEADIVVLFTSTTSSEGKDRASLSLPMSEVTVIDHVIGMVGGQKVVVVGTAPGAVLLPFSENVSALLLAFMPGQEGGNAVADILFGDANPSAKLPLTIPNVENETQFSPSQYPGIDLLANYSEKLLTGYRWYDTNQVTPKYPFGFGLSYTQFSYSSLQVHTGGRSIEFRLTNIGTEDGTEISQVYLSFPPEAGEPPKLLKSFCKTFLHAGAEDSISLTLSDRDFSIWNSSIDDWQIIRGEFIVSVGSSSADLPLKASINTSRLAADKEDFVS